jgi:predicted amidohydrolase
MSTLSTLSTLSTAPHTLYRVGVVQMTATDDRELNYHVCARLVHQAALQHVQFLSFPECFHFIGGGPTTLGSIDIAEPLDGETIQKKIKINNDKIFFFFFFFF